MFTNYSVQIEDFAERHFLKNFKKKYKSAWDITWRAIIEEFKRIDSLFDTEIAEKIICSDQVDICKTEFRVAGTKEFRKSSGNRCIVAVDKMMPVVHILLVYGKTDLSGKNETAE
jgi:hypothetical protein